MKKKILSIAQYKNQEKNIVYIHLTLQIKYVQNL